MFGVWVTNSCEGIFTITILIIHFALHKFMLVLVLTSRKLGLPVFLKETITLFVPKISRPNIHVRCMHYHWYVKKILIETIPSWMVPVQPCGWCFLCIMLYHGHVFGDHIVVSVALSHCTQSHSLQDNVTTILLIVPVTIR